MANKCKICGYKFKRNDGPICPECFTSREEEMICDDFSADLHSHAYGYNPEKQSSFDSANTFLDNERRQENAEKDRLQNIVDEQNRETNDNFRREGVFVNQNTSGTANTNTYQQNNTANTNRYNYTQPRPPYVKQQQAKPNYTQANNAFNPLTQNKPVFNPQLYTRQKKSSKSSGIAVALVIIFAFLIPFIMGIIEAFDSPNNHTSTYSPTITTADIDYPDIDYSMNEYTSNDKTYTITVDDYTTLEEKDKLSDFKLPSDKKQSDYLYFFGDEGTYTGKWSKIKFNYTIKRNVTGTVLPKVQDASVYSYGTLNDENSFSCSSYIVDMDDTGITFYLPSDFEDCSFSIDLINEDYSTETATLYFFSDGNDSN